MLIFSVEANQLIKLTQRRKDSVCLTGPRASVHGQVVFSLQQGRASSWKRDRANHRSQEREGGREVYSYSLTLVKIYIADSFFPPFYPILILSKMIIIFQYLNHTSHDPVIAQLHILEHCIYREMCNKGLSLSLYTQTITSQLNSIFSFDLFVFSDSHKQ